MDKRFIKGQKTWNAGKQKETDLTEIRKCKECKEEKIVTDFISYQRGRLYRYQCKACRQRSRRKGTISNTRFQKGHKIGNRFQIGHIPWYKEKGFDNPRKDKGDWNKKDRFTSYSYKNWRKKVLKRDGNKCVKCNSDKKLHVHHIVPWIENEELRFDMNNGMTLCNSCHGKEEGFKKNHVPYNKLKETKLNKN